MEFWALFTAIACWLVYTLYHTYLSLKNGRASAQATVCVLMSGQSGLAEWFLRSVYSTGAVLTGRLAVVVALEPGDGAAGIVKILSEKNDFSVLSPGEIPQSVEVTPQSWVMDIRSMDMAQLREGPLKTLASF
ncbi:MAG: hypothetical protein ACOY4I_17300 [Bacillota bacterium]